MAYTLPGSPRPAPEAPRVPALRFSDTALHIAGSGLMTLAGQYVLTDKAGLREGHALPVAASLVLALGLAKEIADSRRAVAPEFSWPDLVADAFGVALGAAVVGF